MLFTSLTFIIFLFIIFPIYFALPNKSKWMFLLVCSYIYYSFANPVFLIFLLISTISTYVIGIKINNLNELEEKNNSFDIKKINFKKKF